MVELETRFEEFRKRQKALKDEENELSTRMRLIEANEERWKDLPGIPESTLNQKREIQTQMEALQAEHDAWESNYEIHEKKLQQLHKELAIQDDTLELMGRQYTYLLEARGIDETSFLAQIGRLSPLLTM